MTNYWHVRFQDLSPQYPRRMTAVYNCWNRSEILLGCIKWRPGWNRYVFELNQMNKLVLDAGCLEDLSHFIKQLMDARIPKNRCGRCRYKAVCQTMLGCTDNCTRFEPEGKQT